MTTNDLMSELAYLETVHVTAPYGIVYRLIADGAGQADVPSDVLVADGEREYSFVSGDRLRRVRYCLISVEGGTDVELSCELLPVPVETVEVALADRNAHEPNLDRRRALARADAWRTLQQLKGAAEQAVRGDSLVAAGALFIQAAPERLYDMITDFARMGEWSPTCKACWFDEGHGLAAGSWFTGYNDLPDAHTMPAEYTGHTRSRIAVAHRPDMVEWFAGGSHARWRYTFQSVAGGTVVTESWEYMPIGISFIHDYLGERAQAAIDVRLAAATSGIPSTLAALKRAAEG